jgi:hypothetical protein
MKSSGIKRTMAVFAISAMAVAGIPALAGTAFADSVNQQVEDDFGGPNAVQLYNSSGQAISTKPDGTDSTVRLEAGAGRNVDNLRFEYSINGGAQYITIADVTRNDDGAFSTEWTNPPIGQTVIIQARDITPAGVGNADQASGVQVFPSDPNVETINLNADSAQGYYDSCAGGTNMIVSGTTSVTSTSPSNAPFLATVDGAGNNEDTAPYADITTPSGTFSGYIDLANYDFADQAGQVPDQVVVRALTDVVTAGTVETEDYEAYTLYEQVVTTVTVTDDNNGNGGLPTEVTVKVVDQNGAPVAGARVEQANTGFSDETDSRGEAHFSQTTNPAGGQQYFADENCDGFYQFSAGDRTAAPFQAGNSSSNITIASNPEGRRPVPSSTTETVTVRDGAGNPIVNRQVRVTRNGPDSTNRVDFFNTNAQGQVLFSVTCNVAGTINVEAAFQDPSGSGTPLPSDPFNRKATDTVQCGNAPVNPPTDARKRINPAIKGKNVNGGDDRITVRAKQADGAAVKLFKIVGQNRRVLVDSGRLNGNGVFRTTIKDSNGVDITAYKAVVSATADTQRGVTQRRQLNKVG